MVTAVTSAGCGSRQRQWRVSERSGRAAAQADAERRDDDIPEIRMHSTDLTSRLTHRATLSDPIASAERARCLRKWNQVSSDRKLGVERS